MTFWKQPAFGVLRKIDLCDNEYDVGSELEMATLTGNFEENQNIENLPGTCRILQGQYPSLTET
ncbi:hypothetical protein AMTR_s00106p00099590 [Amborella trichopoda]|uniref:Uncharacterized protein n=1 Tax=Amborella trichopoda TaxID=13333 RepID=W1NTF4_AMBTC|nr:hypothetical protein AMTR_s00106p00099590 [Amborella trichopoda]